VEEGHRAEVLFGSKRESRTLQKNKAGIKIVIIQQSKAHNRSVARISFFIYFFFLSKTVLCAKEDEKEKKNKKFSTRTTARTGTYGTGKRPSMVNTALATLRDSKVVFLNLATGWGKTVTAIYLAATLKTKTLVLCHFRVVVNQLKRSAFVPFNLLLCYRRQQLVFLQQEARGRPRIEHSRQLRLTFKQLYLEPSTLFRLAGAVGCHLFLFCLERVQQYALSFLKSRMQLFFYFFKKIRFYKNTAQAYKKTITFSTYVSVKVDVIGIGPRER